MGSNPCRGSSLLGIAHPIEGKYFRYKECSGSQRSLEAAFEKKADMWLWLCFCKTCMKYYNSNMLEKSVINS